MMRLITRSLLATTLISLLLGAAGCAAGSGAEKNSPANNAAPGSNAPEAGDLAEAEAESERADEARADKEPLRPHRDDVRKLEKAAADKLLATEIAAKWHTDPPPYLVVEPFEDTSGRNLIGVATSMRSGIQSALVNESEASVLAPEVVRESYAVVRDMQGPEKANALKEELERKLEAAYFIRGTLSAVDADADNTAFTLTLSVLPPGEASPAAEVSETVTVTRPPTASDADD